MPTSPKPNANSTLAEIKAYIREYKLNKPEIRLGMKKADLIAGLKKHGHWDSRVKGKNTAVRSGPNRKGEYGPPKNPVKKKKKLSKGQKDFLSGITE